jgi:DNA (cytosine-5)-methyltransferase 1
MASASLTVGSLFSGIGGLDLGLERAGMTVVWQSEIDPYASRVLAKHWPAVPNLGDITKVDWTHVERPDVICGGYPCQPFSLAGVRQGETDPRHLWPHFATAVRHLRPRWALLENVPGHLSMGFGRVLGDLAELGYDCEWDCIPAAAVGAPHLRYRIFVVARNTARVRRWREVGPDSRVPTLDVPDPVSEPVRVEPVSVGRGNGATIPGHDGAHRDVADTDDGRRDGRTRLVGPRRRGQPTNSGWWTVEPDVGRVAHGVPARVDRLRCLGNAVVPQVAELIGRQLLGAV